MVDQTAGTEARTHTHTSGCRSSSLRGGGSQPRRYPRACSRSPPCPAYGRILPQRSTRTQRQPGCADTADESSSSSATKTTILSLASPESMDAGCQLFGGRPWWTGGGRREQRYLLLLERSREAIYRRAMLEHSHNFSVLIQRPKMNVFAKT